MVVTTQFCGIFFLAMPLTIVGSSFAEAWDKLQAKRLKSNTRVNRLNGTCPQVLVLP